MFDQFDDLSVNTGDDGVTSSAQADDQAIGDEAEVTGRSGRRTVRCEVHDDAVTIDGHAWSYYMSQRGKPQMLVVDRATGERMCINGIVDLIVLGIECGQVRLAIENRQALA